MRVAAGVGAEGASVLGASGPDGAPALEAASVDVTVVELTCRLPDDLRPLEEPAEQNSLYRHVRKLSHLK